MPDHPSGIDIPYTNKENSSAKAVVCLQLPVGPQGIDYLPLLPLESGVPERVALRYRPKVRYRLALDLVRK